MQVNLRGIITMSNLIEKGLFAIFNNKDNIINSLSRIMKLFLSVTIYTLMSILALEIYNGDTNWDNAYILKNLYLFYVIGILVMLTVSAIRGIVPQISELLSKTKANYIDWMNEMKADQDMKNLQRKQEVIEMEKQPNTYCTDCGVIINSNFMSQRPTQRTSHYKQDREDIRETVMITPSERVRTESHYKKRVAPVSHYKSDEFDWDKAKVEAEYDTHRTLSRKRNETKSVSHYKMNKEQVKPVSKESFYKKAVRAVPLKQSIYKRKRVNQPSYI